MQSSLNSSIYDRENRMGGSVLGDTKQKELFANSRMGQIIDKNIDKNEERKSVN